MPRIYDISRNDAVIERLNSILRVFQLPNVVVINAMHANIIQNYARQLRSEDLIILDASGGFSADEMDAGLLWAKSQRERVGTAILWIHPRSPSPTEGQALLAAVDAILSADMFESHDWAREIVRWLYRSFNSGDERLGDSEDVLRLMGARATSVLIGELFDSSQQPVDHGDTQAFNEEPLAFSSAIISDREFNWGFADRLIYELPPLLWVYVSEALASIGQCKLEGLGQFRRFYDQSGILSVPFEPATSFEYMTAPDMNFSAGALPKQTVQGIKASFPYLPIKLYDLLATEENRTLTSQLGDLLTDISKSIVNSVHRESSELADFSQYWVEVSAQAAAFASYYLIAAAASRSLKLRKEFHVPMIGTFSSRESGVTFTPVRELLDLIDANPLGRSFSI